MAVAVEAEPDGDRLIETLDAHRQDIQTSECACSYCLRRHSSSARFDFRPFAKPLKHSHGTVDAKQGRR